MGERQRVLVVDDEPSIVDAVATSLRYEGFEVEEAGTGRKALAAAQEHPPDLVILDVMLPKINGLQVLQTIRREGLLMPIIMLSARSGEMDKVAGPDEQEGVAPGTVFVGLSLPGQPTQTRRLRVPGDRERVRQYGAISALDLLRRALDAPDA